MTMSHSDKHHRFKVGFIGGGIDSAIGRAHFSALNIDRNFSVDSGVFSIDPEANRDSGNHYGVDEKRVYESIPDFLERESLKMDAVIVLTPTPLHFEHINLALDKKLAVVSEKALCTSSKAAQQITERVQAEKLFLTVTFTYTGYPMVREVKAMIADGDLGEILFAEVKMPQESFIKQGRDGSAANPQSWRQSDYEIPSVTLDLGTHVVNLLEFITGSALTQVSAVAKHSGSVTDITDNIVAIGETNNGAAVSLIWNKVSLGNRNGLSFSIFGSKGSVTWAQEDPEHLVLTDKQGVVQIIDRSHPTIKVASNNRYERFKVGHPAGYIEAFANLYSDIAQSLWQFKAGELEKSMKNEFLHDAKNSASGLRVLEAIHESAQKKMWVQITR